VTQGDDPPEPPAAVTRRGDPPEPPAAVTRGDDPPEPPAAVTRGDDPPEPLAAAGRTPMARVGRRRVADWSESPGRGPRRRATYPRGFGSPRKARP